MEITPAELKIRFDRGERLTLIDIRESKEHAVCHLKEARLIPIKELPHRLHELNPDDFIVIYCHHGIRSAQAALWLRRNGFQNVKSLQGGIEAWARLIDPKVKRY